MYIFLMLLYGIYQQGFMAYTATVSLAFYYLHNLYCLNWVLPGC